MQLGSLRLPLSMPIGLNRHNRGVMSSGYMPPIQLGSCRRIKTLRESLDFPAAMSRVSIHVNLSSGGLITMTAADGS